MRLFILPGMGATAEMYGGAWHSLAHANFLDWPAYQAEASLDELAGRIVTDSGITHVDVPVGSSLGGMVALEIAAQVGARAVCLVGSARSRDEINPFIRCAAPLAQLTPLGLAQILAGSSGGEIGRQFAQTDARFIRAMCEAVARWQAPAFRGRVLRVHGERDHLIPCPRDAAVIRSAGHLVAVTHATECVDALRALLWDAGL